MVKLFNLNFLSDVITAVSNMDTLDIPEDGCIRNFYGPKTIIIIVVAKLLLSL